MMRVRCSYSPKQLVTIRDFAKDKMAVDSGPFGCGKTYSLVIAFGIYCSSLKELGTTGLTFVLCGRTQQSVKRNMGNVLANNFGSDFKYTKSNKDGLDRDAVLFSQNIYIIGFNDSSSREKFQGISDIVGILHDEATLCEQSDFDYAIGRLRGQINVEGNTEIDEDAEYIEIDDTSSFDINSVRLPDNTVPMWYRGSCNPDVPTHFIKKYIDSGLIKNNKWYMKDAIWGGSKAYYEKLKMQYKNNPAFFARYINGKWTSADRMVYPMFLPKVHIISAVDFDVDYKSFKRNFIGVDYGSDHPTAIVLGSVNYQGIYIISKEFKFRNVAPSDIAVKIGELKQFLIDVGSYCSNIFVDPSAKSLKDELDKVGINDYTNAMNSHIDGIGKIQTLFSTARLFILDTCVELIGEIYSYRYKENNTNGKDTVIKTGDDLVDSMRYGVYTDSVINNI